MSRRYFVNQTATKEILARVTDVCASCYSSLKEGENIYYDMQECHYLCVKCQEIKEIECVDNENRESLDQNLGLF